MKNAEREWTAQDIPSKGATVIMPARDLRKAKDAAERVEAEAPKAQLYLAKLDLAEFDSVREFCERLRQRYGTGNLDLLVNNHHGVAEANLELPRSRTANCDQLLWTFFTYCSAFPSDEGRGRVEDCHGGELSREFGAP